MKNFQEFFDGFRKAINNLDDRPITMADVFQDMRKYENLTVPDMSERLDVSVEDLLLIENGNKLPSEEVLNKFAKVFNVRTKDIMFYISYGNTQTERIIKRAIWSLVGLGS